MHTSYSVDDHPLIREGIGTIINCQTDMSLVGSASNGRERIEAFRALRPDVTLIDLRLPDLCGLDVGEDTVKNRRTALFKGRHFQDEIVMLCVSWYLRFSLSYRDLEELLAERNLSVDYTTVGDGYSAMDRN